ncbi:MAG: efflux RND transporter periplasmic adaptor subunit [Thermodesulfobacteriota bacterium]|nr:efflux RND transporter periplasmic adaptor subunit [Thermodesulfobacteriota bacterium]
MKRWLIGVLIIAGVTGLLFYLFTRDKSAGNPYIKISGNIETTEVNIGFKIPGRIVSLSVKEGDWVEKGRMIAKLDDEDLRQRLELARATLKSAQARLEKLLAGSRPEEVRKAEASLQEAQFDSENKKVQYERMKALFDGRVIARETMDNAETKYKIARATLERATENYKLVKEGPRREDIEDAKAQVEQARASLKLSETQLSYTVLHSPISGVVLVKSGEAGEVVNPGTSILTLADIENVWLKAYIPEIDLSRVKWGQEVVVTTDLRPQKEYQGRISFISSQAEFTPKQIQTEKERVTLVYRIKVDIPNPIRELKPGMPADGRILLSPSVPSKP